MMLQSHIHNSIEILFGANLSPSIESSEMAEEHTIILIGMEDRTNSR